VPGKVEMAQGGTLFLDEIGDLPHDVQGKLLRFLQERTFERVGGRQTLTADVRVVCATHQDLERLVAEGKFREDLYYRIRVVEIEIPPLRARGPNEIEQLAHHFADMYALRYKRPAPELSPEAVVVLRGHAWPGNVRELEHWIESAVVLAPDGRIGASHLPRPRRPLVPSSSPMVAAAMVAAPPAVATPGAVQLPLGLTLEEATRRYVAATLESCDNNKTETARRLAVGRNTIGRMFSRDSDPGAGAADAGDAGDDE
jgi:Nif-specific regulatory protein